MAGYPFTAFGRWKKLVGPPLCMMAFQLLVILTTQYRAVPIPRVLTVGVLPFSSCLAHDLGSRVGVGYVKGVRPLFISPARDLGRCNVLLARNWRFRMSATRTRVSHSFTELVSLFSPFRIRCSVTSATQTGTGKESRLQLTHSITPVPPIFHATIWTNGGRLICLDNAQRRPRSVHGLGHRDPGFVPSPCELLGRRL